MKLAGVFLVSIILVGCASSPPIFDSTQAPIVQTSQPSITSLPPTATDIIKVPTPTDLPGELLIPINQFANTIPWIEQDPRGPTYFQYLVFNVNQPPFDDPLVRRALALSADREVIADITRGTSSNLVEITPASTLTPPMVMGRDLFGQVGPAYDPAIAEELLAEAGYPGGGGFPEITFLVFATWIEDNPEAMIA
ncbi:MAG: ABC transporter substrate-binding protein, partial [Anaerolineaceae bacterium]|nr:ABC transporter substrate-binding protein [Anaerolineaceae bacterium]